MSILKIENLSKQYRLGVVGTGTLSHDLNRWWHKVRGNEDPYLKIGETNNQASVGESPYVWALKDINFEVLQGEVLGIIGKNGAGKSTLLKILSQVTSPTTGKIYTKGRIASLLEVGTGFHPELTGRENIFLNGAILGMTKAEIRAKLDEIIEFSGVARYIDTPVKRYSSGMKVRLAFAVAAHLEPEILVVDEVLAVGDAEFQKKAIGKMQDISKGEGRTVLFVSHNMAAVKSLCTRGIVLEDGKVVFDGSVDECVSNYLQRDIINLELHAIKDRIGNGKVSFEKVKVFGESVGKTPVTGGVLNFLFKIKNKNLLSSEKIRFDMRIEDDFHNRLVWLSSSLKEITNIENTDQIKLTFPKNPLNKGIYFATIYMEVEGEISDLIENAFSFEIEEGDFFFRGEKIPYGQNKVFVDFEMNYL